MIGFVPFATPQTFSRIVVFPALALPITRIRKWGHRKRSLSNLISSSLGSEMDQSIKSSVIDVNSSSNLLDKTRSDSSDITDICSSTVEA